jgi:hypothetical protein
MGVAATFERYGLAAALYIGADERIDVVLFSIGREEHGLLGAAIFYEGRTTSDLYLASYRDNLDNARKRIDVWLDRGLARALTLWRETL